MLWAVFPVDTSANTQDIGLYSMRVLIHGPCGWQLMLENLLIGDH